jgi:hypothetical protein
MADAPTVTINGLAPQPGGNQPARQRVKENHMSAHDRALLRPEDATSLEKFQARRVAELAQIRPPQESVTAARSLKPSPQKAQTRLHQHPKAGGSRPVKVPTAARSTRSTRPINPR